MHVEKVKSVWENFRAYVARNAEFCKEHPAAQVSSFWAEYFNDRPNFPEIQDILAFRRNNATWGSGDTLYADQETKFKEYRDTLAAIRLFVPDDFIRSLQEPYFGAPVIFTIDDITHSANFVMNAGTAWRMKALLQQYGAQKNTYDFCEIGAGFGGCSYQLHQIAPINSYTVVDLAENLCLSSVFLATCLPEKALNFVECDPLSVDTKVDNALKFSLPPGIDKLTGKFDVMLNTFSFQEMDLESVLAYLKWSSSVLSDDGVLISFNSHDKAGITRASQYCVEGLELIHLKTFRAVPTGFFNTIPYEMVLTKSDARNENFKPEVLDPICEMMQLGLDHNLHELIQKMFANQLNEQDVQYLKLVEGFFYADRLSVREEYVARLSEDRESSISQFLVGNFMLRKGELALAKDALQASCNLGLDDFAKVRAKAALGVIYNMTGDWSEPREQVFEELRLISGGLFDEIKEIIDTKNLYAIQVNTGAILNWKLTSKNMSTLLKGALRKLSK